MFQLFSEECRRNPFPTYERMRTDSPVFREPASNLWMVFDYDGVKQVVTDHAAFSARHGPADWMGFQDPPRHTKLRALISKAFTPRSISNLETRIRELTCSLLDRVVHRGAMDVGADFAAPLPISVIAEMLGVSVDDRHRFHGWNDAILNLSYTVPGIDAADVARRDFAATSAEMDAYLGVLLEQRRSKPSDDLLTRLLDAELDGERLTRVEILGFFQLLLLAGSETTTNLINNAILCFNEHRDQFHRLREQPELLPSAIEEVLRYRSPVQWMFRRTTRDVPLGGQTIPSGSIVLAMYGSANRDPRWFEEPDRFDITRDPNPHLAFGHGAHFCLGAPLARLEARIALTELLQRVPDFELADPAPWQPRRGLHVHGPARLPIRFAPVPRV